MSLEAAPAAVPAHSGVQHSGAETLSVLYPQHCNAFTGRAVKQTLTKIVGPDADYLGDFLFRHKIVRKIGFGRVDRIISDDTLYRLDYKKYRLQQRGIRNGSFPEETAYFERRAAESRDAQN